MVPLPPILVWTAFALSDKCRMFVKQQVLAIKWWSKAAVKRIAQVSNGAEKVAKE